MGFVISVLNVPATCQVFLGHVMEGRYCVSWAVEGEQVKLLEGPKAACTVPEGANLDEHHNCWKLGGLRSEEVTPKPGARRVSEGTSWCPPKRGPESTPACASWASRRQRD